MPVDRRSVRRIIAVERRGRAASTAAVVGAMVVVAFGVAPLLGSPSQVIDQVKRRTLADVQPSAAPADPPAPIDQARQQVAAEAARRGIEDRQSAEAERQRLAAAAVRRHADEERARRAAVEAARRSEEQRPAAEAERQRLAVAAAKQQAEEDAARQAAALERQRLATAEAWRQADEEKARRVAAEQAAAAMMAAEAARQAEERARLQAEAQRKAQAEAEARAAAEAARQVEERARPQAEAQRYAEAETRAIAEAQAANEKAEAEARARSDSDARRRTTELVWRAALAAARQEADAWPKVEAEARQLAEAAESALQLSDADRRRVQATLISVGHDIGGTTGFFGPRTRAMIRAWQKQQALPETGYLTAQQLSALQLQASALVAQGARPPTTADTGPRRPESDPRRAETEEAALGLTDMDRRRAQAALTALGHEIGATTGFFGPRTRAMISAWQKKQGSSETGYLTGPQWTELQAQAAAVTKERDEGRGVAPDLRQAQAEEAALGLSETDRKRMQMALAAVGHDIGGTTGYIGPRTRAMIAAWQKKQGMPDTGFLTAAQWTALQQQAAPALSRYDTSGR